MTKRKKVKKRKSSKANDRYYAIFYLILGIGFLLVGNKWFTLGGLILLLVDVYWMWRAFG